AFALRHLGDEAEQLAGRARPARRHGKVGRRLREEAGQPRRRVVLGGQPLPALRVSAEKQKKGSDLTEQVAEPEISGRRPEPLPYSITEGDRAEFAVSAQPFRGFRQREQRAGRGAADRAGKILITTSPIAHRSSADVGQPRYIARVHRGVLAHNFSG